MHLLPNILLIIITLPFLIIIVINPSRIWVRREKSNWDAGKFECRVEGYQGGCKGHGEGTKAINLWLKVVFGETISQYIGGLEEEEGLGLLNRAAEGGVHSCE